ncbi:hypothetical protein [Paenibacillus sp. BGI2013]|uniref:hypothetical protein n=1 Tax=Paenibacillus sp. BGI2013 TaxID=2058902 RepID=UPI0015D614BB|nr:hypothetical protein [Paenibacillus sp. BGI2013]
MLGSTLSKRKNSSNYRLSQSLIIIFLELRFDIAAALAFISSSVTTIRPMGFDLNFYDVTKHWYQGQVH